MAQTERPAGSAGLSSLRKRERVSQEDSQTPKALGFGGSVRAKCPDGSDEFYGLMPSYASASAHWLVQ